jgi:hypothetical protein
MVGFAVAARVTPSTHTATRPIMSSPVLENQQKDSFYIKRATGPPKSLKPTPGAWRPAPRKETHGDDVGVWDLFLDTRTRQARLECAAERGVY